MTDKAILPDFPAVIPHPGEEEALQGKISAVLGVNQLNIWPVFTKTSLATGHSSRGCWEWGWEKEELESQRQLPLQLSFCYSHYGFS